jgi:hypothetical protein
MLPPTASDRRPRESLEYRDEPIHNRRLSGERPYVRNDIKSESSTLSTKPDTSTIETKRKEIIDPGRETLNNGAAPVRGPPRPPMDAKLDDHPSSYGYDRERHGPPPDRYRETGDYGRAPYSTFEGRGRDSDPRDIREPPAYDKPRDPRDPYYSSPANYPPAPLPPSDYRGRDAYPPRQPPPLDYPRGPAPAFDERFPRGPPMDLEPPNRGREGFRDLPPRPPEFGQKRKFDSPEYMDPYYDDYRVNPLERRC